MNIPAEMLVELVKGGRREPITLSPEQIALAVNEQVCPLQVVINSQTSKPELIMGRSQKRICQTKYVEKERKGEETTYLETPFERLKKTAAHIALGSVFKSILNRTRDKTSDDDLTKILEGVEHEIETKDFSDGSYAKRILFHKKFGIEQTLDLKKNFKKFKRNLEGFVAETLKDVHNEVGELFRERVSDYEWLMNNGFFMPNSPTLMNAGKQKSTEQFSACFVLPYEDNIVSIMLTAAFTAFIHQTGGGTGYDFSKLRPRGATVYSTGGVASGPFSFAKFPNEIVEEVVQGGTRAGAMMLCIKYDHPNALEIISSKIDPLETLRNKLIENLDNYSLTQFTKIPQLLEGMPEATKEAIKRDGRLDEISKKAITEFLRSDEFRETVEPHIIKNLKNYNISLGFDEAFVDAVKADKDIQFQFEGKPWKVQNPFTGEEIETINAREYLMLISKLIHKTGDPGMINFGRINRTEANPIPGLGQIWSTNPCGEQPLHPYDACNLGSIDISRTVKIKNEGSNNLMGNFEIDYDLLGEVVDKSVYFLDDVKSISLYPIKNIEAMVREVERIGLGVMGFHHLLIKLGISYDSQEATKTAEDIMEFINKRAFDASQKLASERGVYFAYDKGIHNPQSPHYNKAILEKEYGPRDSYAVAQATRITIAPTGTIANFIGASNGAEPIFAVLNERKMQSAFDKEKRGEKPVINVDYFLQIDPLFKAVVESKTENGKVWGRAIDDVLEDIRKNKGSVQEIPYIDKDTKNMFKTAMDIPPEDHYKILVAFQKHTNNAVSKTINMPKYSTVPQIYDMLLKFVCEEEANGITIYRDGSKGSQVINFGQDIFEDSTPEEMNGLAKQLMGDFYE